MLRSGNGMHAVDTNLLVRVISADEAVQSPNARQFIADHHVFVAKMVLLECEWVLRKTYGLTRESIYGHLRDLAGLAQVTVETPDQVANALDWFVQGMDFADALHLAAAMQAGCEALATFDRKLAAAARKVGAGGVELL